MFEGISPDEFREFCAGIGMTPAQIANQLNPGRAIHWREHMSRFRFLLDDLYQEAARAREERASSYRGFLVGCAAYTFNGYARTYKDRWKIVTGANSKDSKTSPKVCAEKRMLEQAEKSSCTLVIGMVIVGEPQFDDVSNLQCKTLHPCHECRQRLSRHSLIRPDTYVVTALPPEIKGYYDPWRGVPKDRWSEEHTLRDILRIHREPYRY